MVMNGVGTVGRLLPTYIADRVGTLTIFVPTAGLGATMLFCWMSVSSVVSLYAWAAITGIALGGIQALFPSALAALTTDPRTQGMRIGMIFTIVSFSVLTGAPLSGAILSALQGRYIGAQGFAGSSLAAGATFIALAREVKRRKVRARIWDKI